MSFIFKTMYSQRLKSFRTRKNRNNDLTCFINVENPEEFYFYEGPQQRIDNKKIYKEHEIEFHGRFIKLRNEASYRFA